MDISKIIEHLENCIVHKDNWRDRDSHSCQISIGELWVLIKSGHRIEIWNDYKDRKGAKMLDEDEFFDQIDDCINIVYVYDIHDFSYVDSSKELNGEEGAEATFYVPTPHYLWMVGEEDWY